VSDIAARDIIDDEATARAIDWSLGHVPLVENRRLILMYLVKRRSGSKPLRMSSLRAASTSLSGWAEHLDQTPMLEATREQLNAYLAKDAHMRHYRTGPTLVAHDRLVHVTESAKWRWKVGFRDFYRVMDPGAARRLFEGMRIGRQPTRHIQRSDLITREELLRVAATLTSPCDRALLLLFYETGFRVGELCALNVESVAFDEDGPALVSIPTDGKDLKTGARSVPVLECVTSLRAWLAQHPRRDEPKAPLFVNTRLKRGTRLTVAQVGAIVRRWFRNAGITRRIWPHLLRHTRATQLAASGMNDSLMRLFFGWTPSSPMPSLYSHMAQCDLDDAMYRYWNHPRRRQPSTLGIGARPCKRCGQANLPHATNCQSCRAGLDFVAGRVEDDGVVDALLEAVLPEAARLAAVVQQAQRTRAGTAPVGGSHPPER